MAELADGFIALPGGLGTLEELTEVASWAQLDLHAKPIGLLGPDGYWDGLLAWLDRAVAEGFIAPHHRTLVAVDRRPGRAAGTVRGVDPAGLALVGRARSLTQGVGVGFGVFVGVGVGQGVGGVPGAGKSMAATARIVLRSGTCDVAVAGLLRVDERMTDDRADHRVVATHLVHDRGEFGEAVDRDVRLDGVAHGLEQRRQLEQDAAAARHLVAQRDEDLLLAIGPGEVALARALADPGVGERLGAGEMVRPLLDDEPVAVRGRSRRSGVGTNLFLTSTSTPPTASTIATNPTKSIRA